MENGDLSAVPSRTYMVTLDALCLMPPEPVKKRFLRKPKATEEADRYQVSDLLLSKLYSFWHDNDARLELVLFDISEAGAAELHRRMVSKGCPINCYSIYLTRADLVRELRYRPDVIAVIEDTLSHALHYGSRGMRLEEL